MPTSDWRSLPGKSGIPYTVGILEGDIAQQLVPGASSITAVCYVDWEYRHHFLADMIGFSRLITVSNNVYLINRIIPEECPFKRTAEDGPLYAVSADLIKVVQWKANGSPASFNGWPGFATAVYRVTFASTLYVVKNDDAIAATGEYNRFCQWHSSSVVKEEMQPGSAFYFVGTGKTRPVPEVATRTGRLIKLECKWLDVPGVPQANFLALANRVNSGGGSGGAIGTDTLTLNGVVYQPETVLFEGYDEVPRISPLGSPSRDITLRFLIRADGRSWNTWWDASATGTNRYVRITSDGTSLGKLPYEVGDLKKLWSFNA